MRDTEPRPDELRALSRLLAVELGGGAGGIGSMHEAIAQRVFGNLGLGAEPARAMHDAIARGVYAALAGAATLAGGVADRVLSRRDPGDGRPISATPRGALALAVLNGLYGDALELDGSDLQEPMAVRVDGAIVAPEQLADAFPEATPRIVVFLHGLMETEHAWRLGGGPSYGARLARDLGCTPVYVRYNSGRHVSHNGRALADLLEDLVAAWPVEVEQIALVGHSLGGLVARSAGCQASERGQRWVTRVRHVVSLGTPCPRRARSDASCAAGAPASATCARARWSTATGRAATPTRCARPHARRCRCSTAPCTASSPRRSPAPTAIRSRA